MSEWISVNERLPAISGWYLVATKYPDCDNCHVVRSWFDGDFKRRNVTHWMPLPEPPK